MQIFCKLTIFFDNPFWVGVFERIEEDQLQACRHVFGAEPKDYDVYDFILKQYYQLEFSDPILVSANVEKSINLKRLQKKIGRELENIRVGTKAQAAMKLQYETNKNERKTASKELKESIEKHKFELKQLKKKEKHRGH